MLILDQKLRFECLEFVLELGKHSTFYKGDVDDADYLYQIIKDKKDPDLFFRILNLILDQQSVKTSPGFKAICNVAKRVDRYVEKGIFSNEEVIDNE